MATNPMIRYTITAQFSGHDAAALHAAALHYAGEHPGLDHLWRASAQIPVSISDLQSAIAYCQRGRAWSGYDYRDDEIAARNQVIHREFAVAERILAEALNHMRAVC